MIWVFLVLGCVPKIDPGPIAVETAQAPVPLLVLPDASGPNVYFQVTVAAGSANDPLGKEGLASLTAQSMTTAGADDRGRSQVQQALYPTGNALEVVVDREWTTFRLTCHRDHATLCLDIFADTITKPLFEDSEVFRLRDQALYDVTDGLLGNEEALAFEVFNAWLFEGHPYGHPVSGRAGVLPLLQTDDVRQFYREHFVREAMTAGIAGNFDPTLQQEFEARLTDISTGRRPERPLQRPLPVQGRALLAVDTDTPVTGYILGQSNTIDRNHPDWPALYLAFVALGEHRQSHGRLFRELRTARGLNYGDYSYMEPFVQRGSGAMPEQGVLRTQSFTYFWIRPTSTENGAFALKLAIAEVESFAKDGLTSQEFEDIRQYTLGRLPLLAQSPGRRLAFAVEAAATRTPNPLEHLPKTLPALTVEEVNAAIAKHVQPENLKIVAVSGEAKSLVQQLIEENPTPIVYANGIQPSADQAARDSEVAGKSLQITEANSAYAKGIFR